MTPEQRRIASLMWKDGVLASKISAKLGVKLRVFHSIVQTDRHRFPHRYTNRAGKRCLASPTVHHSAPSSAADRMTWITESGASVTLPRISMIECPRCA